MTFTYYHALSAICQPIHTTAYPRSLHPLRCLLNTLGNPHERFPSIVIAGSVGKGTVCYSLTQSLQVSGMKVGLYTSPHMHSFRERFAVNGVMISQSDFATGMDIITQAISPGTVYSTFEMATTLALWWFARERVDIVVLECSLGGRWDAVNVVSNSLAIITPIECEHVAMLGGSLQTITWHKAGVIRRGGHVVTVPQSSIVMEMLEDEARFKGARLHRTAGFSPHPLAPYPHNRKGEIAVEVVKDILDLPDDIEPPQEFATLPGRLEKIVISGRTVIIDGGHTPKSAVRLWQAISAHLQGEAHYPVWMIIGMLRDKSAHAFLTVFDKPGVCLTITTTLGHRAADPNAIVKQSQLQYATSNIIPDLNAALAQVYTAPESLVVVTGSMRMAAAAREAYGLLSDEELAEAQATRKIFEGEDYLAKLNRISPE